MKNSRLNLLISLILLAALGLGACGSPATAVPQPTTAPTSQPAAPTSAPAATTAPTAAPAATTAPATAPAGATVQQPSGEPIKIGFYAPITGAAAADGESAQRAADLAVEVVNEEGGVLGRPIQLVSYDDAFSPDEAANVVRRMIEQDKVAAIVSGSYSFTTRAGAPIAQEAGVPFMAAYAVHPLVTETGEYVWRIGALAPIQGRAGAQIVFDKLKAKNVAILIVDNDFGTSLTEGFKSRAAELGMNIVYEEKYPLGESDFRPLLNGIKDAKPDVIYATGYYAEAAALVAQMKEAGIDIQVVGQEGYDSPTFLTLAGENANGVIFTSDLNRDSDRPAVQEFLKRFEDTYKTPADAVGASVYDAVRVVAAGIQAGGSTDPKAILEGLKSLKNFDLAVTGPILQFTPGREVVRPIGAQIVKDNAFHFYAEVDDLSLVTPDK